MKRKLPYELFVKILGKSFEFQLHSQLHFQLLHSALNGQYHLKGVKLCLFYFLNSFVYLLGLPSRLIDFLADLYLEKFQLAHQAKSVLFWFLLQVALHACLLLSNTLYYEECTEVSYYRSCSLSATYFKSLLSASNLAKKLDSVFWAIFCEVFNVWLALRVLLRLISKSYKEL